MAIDRKRKRDTSPGMGLPEPGNESRSISQLQSAVQSVSARIAELESKTTAETPRESFDPQSILRAINDLKSTVAMLTSQVAQMKWEFPVHKFAKIATVGTAYLSCNWYFPATATIGGAVNVAVPPGQTVGDYAADQIVTVARAKTDVLDDDSMYITWVANEGGGGGDSTYFADSKPELPTTDIPLGSRGYVLGNYNKQYVFTGLPIDSEHNNFGWLCVSHTENIWEE